MNKNAFLQLLLTIVIGSLLAADPGRAATIMVDTTADPGSGANCSLRHAIINANNNDQSGSTGCAAGNSGLDEIVFDPAMAGVTITLNGTPLPFISEALVITGPVLDDPSGITIDGDGASRILIMQGAGTFTVSVSGLTLTGGFAGFGQSGGAIASFSANIQLNHMRIFGNTGGIEGGGVAVFNGRFIVLENSIVENNETTGTFGQGGGLAIRGDAMLINSTVSGNSTVGSGPGGGLAASGNAFVFSSAISDNATVGDGAAGGGLSVAGSATLVNSTVSNNRTSGSTAHGGGIFVDTGSLDVTNSTVDGNSTEGDGAHGGGIFVNDSSVSLLNSTVSGNLVSGASAHGGGISASAGITAVHGTVAFNSAADGIDGLHIAGTGSLELNNSLVVQGDLLETACSEPAAVHENSLSTDTSCSGAAIALADIALEPLADNGGPTETHALGKASVAIDAAGDCTADVGVTDDQRIQPRPGFNSEACDIGAYEFAAGVVFRDRFEMDI